MGSPESDKQDIDKVFAPSNYESVVKAEPLEPDKNQTRKQWWDNSDQKTDIKNENSKDQIKTPKIKNKKMDNSQAQRRPLPTTIPSTRRQDKVQRKRSRFERRTRRSCDLVRCVD